MDAPFSGKIGEYDVSFAYAAETHKFIGFSAGR
jgi:hypothetical protein